MNLLLFSLVTTDGVHTLVEFGDSSLFVAQIDRTLVFSNSAKNIPGDRMALRQAELSCVSEASCSQLRLDDSWDIRALFVKDVLIEEALYPEIRDFRRSRSPTFSQSQPKPLLIALEGLVEVTMLLVRQPTFLSTHS